MSNDIVLEIYELLKKYYINYKPNKWINLKSIDDFKKRWGKEHGGYLSLEELDKYKPKKEKIKKNEYPKIKNVMINNSMVKAIWIPTAVWNDKKIQKNYIKVANNLILENFKDLDTITIDLNYNFGGKDTVMVSALSPIFNLSKRKRLVNVKTKSGIKEGLFKISEGNYGSSSNPSLLSTKKKLVKLKNINIILGETFSAGEVIAIAFKSIADQFNINFYGYKTFGATSYIKQFNLSDGSIIEIPIGYMTDAFGNQYKDGIDIN